MKSMNEFEAALRDYGIESFNAGLSVDTVRHKCIIRYTLNAPSRGLPAGFHAEGTGATIEAAADDLLKKTMRAIANANRPKGGLRGRFRG